jgi:hypothetical protein
MDGEMPFVPWIPKTAGEKSVLDELPASKTARVGWPSCTPRR